jgi:hypothetical protein
MFVIEGLMNGHFLLHLERTSNGGDVERETNERIYFLFLMRLDEHGLGHHFAGKGLARVGIDQFVASSKTTLKAARWSELKTKHTRMKLTLPRNLPLEY